MSRQEYIDKYGFAPIPAGVDITPIQPDNNYFNYVIGHDKLVFGIKIKNEGVNSLMKYKFRGAQGKLLPGNSLVLTADHPRYYMNLDLSLKFEDCDLGDVDKAGNVIPFPVGVVYQASILEEFVIPNFLNC